jgi:hypothetical protein
VPTPGDLNPQLAIRCSDIRRIDYRKAPVFEALFSDSANQIERIGRNRLIGLVVL